MKHVLVTKILIETDIEGEPLGVANPEVFLIIKTYNNDYLNNNIHRISNPYSSCSQ